MRRRRGRIMLSHRIRLMPRPRPSSPPSQPRVVPEEGHRVELGDGVLKVPPRLPLRLLAHLRSCDQRVRSCDYV